MLHRVHDLLSASGIATGMGNDIFSIGPTVIAGVPTVHMVFGPAFPWNRGPALSERLAVHALQRSLASPCLDCNWTVQVEHLSPEPPLPQLSIDFAPMFCTMIAIRNFEGCTR